MAAALTKLLTIARTRRAGWTRVYINYNELKLIATSILTSWLIMLGNHRAARFPFY